MKINFNFEKVIKTAIVAYLVFVFLFVLLNFSSIKKTFVYKLREKKVTFQNQTASTTPELQSLEQNSLSIPDINLNAKISYAEVTDENKFQEMLNTSVVHYPGTAMPGDVGNCYIFGHSSNYAWVKGEYKTIFALLPQLTKGQIIYIRGEGAKVFKYKIFDTKIILPNQTEFLNQETNGKKILTLQTSYPLGTALKRFIVLAEIEN